MSRRRPVLSQADFFNTIDQTPPFKLQSIYVRFRRKPMINLVKRDLRDRASCQP